MKWTDQHVEVLVSDLLRAGVLTSSATVATGLCIELISRAPLPDVHRYPVERAGPSASTGIFLIWLGLWILVATPVARVVFTVFAFVVQRDRLYVGVTLLVLCILVYSLIFPR